MTEKGSNQQVTISNPGLEISRATTSAFHMPDSREFPVFFPVSREFGQRMVRRRLQPDHLNQVINQVDEKGPVQGGLFRFKRLFRGI